MKWFIAGLAVLGIIFIFLYLCLRAASKADRELRDIMNHKPRTHK